MNQVERANEWADRLAERVFIKETEYVPDAVATMAAIKFLARVSRRNRKLLPKSMMLRLLSVSLDEIADSVGSA